MKASANLLWLGAAVTLSAFVSAYVVAMFVADRLTDCTTPAVLPVAYSSCWATRSWPPRSASSTW